MTTKKADDEVQRLSFEVASGVFLFFFYGQTCTYFLAVLYLCVVGNADDLVDWTGLDGRPLGSQESIINSYIIILAKINMCDGQGDRPARDKAQRVTN